MIIEKVRVNGFRALNNQTIKLGKYVTVLCGNNASGKSTVLGLIANSIEAKINDCGRPFGGGAFRAEFSEIFKGELEFEPSKSDIAVITFINGDESYEVSYRRSWRDNYTRYRIIPRNQVTGSEAKENMPIIYLGLSRLLPVGEVGDDEITIDKKNIIDGENLNWFREKHKDILNIDDDVEETHAFTLKEMRNKKIGANFKNYNYKTCSAGQDNLSKILMSILSFKRLHNEGRSGGMLVIDELDATLHPKAQTKLFKLISYSAREYNFQCVFTTHSFFLIELVSKKNRRNKEDELNDFEINHFGRYRDGIRVKQNKSYQNIKDNLLMTKTNANITVYSEDESTRWLLSEITPSEVTDKYNLLDCTLSCDSMISLLASNPMRHRNDIFIFDGDLGKIRLDKLDKNTNKNFICLPSTNECCPEKDIITYIQALLSPASTGQHSEAVEKAEELNLTFDMINEELQAIEDNRPNREKGKSYKFKTFFFKYKSIIIGCGLVDCWKEDNKDIIEEFNEKLVQITENIERKLLLK